MEKLSQFIVYGQPVPQSEIDEIIADGTPLEEITNDMLEVLYFYEYQDNL